MVNFKTKVISAVLCGLTLTAVPGCRNISAEDVGMSDIVNIVNYIFPSSKTSESVTDDQTTAVSASVSATTPVQSQKNQTAANAATEPAGTTAPAISVPGTTSDSYIIDTPADTAPAVNVDNSAFPELPARFLTVQLPKHVKFTDERIETIKLLDRLPVKDFGGIDYKVLTYQPQLFTPPKDENRVNESRYYRNALIEKQFNVNIVSMMIDEDSLFRMLEKAANVGEDFADLICLPMSQQYLFMINGLLVNLNKIPFLNLEAPYYNKSLIQAATSTYPVYQFASDLTISPEQSGLLVYNKDIIKTTGLEDPYTLFKNGTWTLDRLIEYTKASALDLDGNNRYNEGDRYGIAIDTGSPNGVNIFVNSSDIDYFPHFKGILPAMNYNYPRTQTLINLAKELFVSANALMTYKNSDYNNRMEFFNTGKAAFAIADASIIKTLPTQNLNYGLLPMPKLDESQSDYVTFTETDDITASIQNNHLNTEFCGMITEALCAASYSHIKTEFVTEMMLYHLRDHNSVEVLKKVVSNVKFDFSQIGSSQAEIYNASTGLMNSVITSNGRFETLYNSNLNTVTKYIEKTIK